MYRLAGRLSAEAGGRMSQQKLLFGVGGCCGWQYDLATHCLFFRSRLFLERNSRGSGCPSEVESCLFCVERCVLLHVVGRSGDLVLRTGIVNSETTHEFHRRRVLGSAIAADEEGPRCLQRGRRTYAHLFLALRS